MVPGSERRRYGPGGEVPGDPAQARDHHDGFVEDRAGLGLGLAGAGILDPKTVALVQVGALAAIGSPAVCLEWSTTRALRWAAFVDAASFDGAPADGTASFNSSRAMLRAIMCAAGPTAPLTPRCHSAPITPWGDAAVTFPCRR